LSNKKILLIDDDPGILSSITRWLQKQGYKVETAESGIQGMEKLEAFLPDLIISDMRMPELDGVEFMMGVPDGDGFFPGKIIFTGFDDNEAVELATLAEGGIFRVEKDRWETDLPVAISRAIELGVMKKEAWKKGEENGRLKIMRSAGTMLGHELEVPLNNIISENERLIEESGWKDSNRIIKESVDRINKISERIATLYELENLEYSPGMDEE